MKHFTYSCGCKFPVEENNGITKINFQPKIEELDLECQRTWDLISEGNTKGVFQLESRLGKQTAKKLKPENIEQLSALIAILRPGCISGDTRIAYKIRNHKDGNIRYISQTIRKIAENPKLYPNLLSYDEGTGKIISNEMINVFHTGNKECFKVVLRTCARANTAYAKGFKKYNLECTKDHKLLTTEGWKELKDIKLGERVLVLSKRGFARIPGLGDRTFRLRCYHKYEYKCIFCDWNKGSLDVNHIDGNRLVNNDPDNLCFMCPNHHREFTEGNISLEEIYEAREKYLLPEVGDFKWATLQNKFSVGVKDVYDISMRSPHNNFIAGNVVVHNCLEALRDGKSVTNHYIDKKNALESVDYFHPALEPILSSTYGEMIYQEQAMEIAKVISGFNLQEADGLRKAIGKKKPEEMAKVKKKFIKGAKKLKIVNEDEAEQIFGWIEKSQRYSFNKSHSVSYAINGYLSAYAKAHFPKVFFASYLRFAKDKIDPQMEIKELVQNAVEMDIDIRPPDIRHLNKHFILKNNKVYFGLTDIKGLGNSVFEKLIKLLDNFDLDNRSWVDMLLKIMPNINSTAAKALIQSGSLSYFKKSRNSMLFEFGVVSNLTKKELDFIIENQQESLSECLEYLCQNGKINKNRKSIIDNLLTTLKKPPYSLEDSPEWIADTEDTLLGCSITCGKVDMYDISMCNTTCKDFKNGERKDNIILGGEIDYISVVKTKKGKNPGAEMSFVTIKDSTGALDSVIFFPDQYREYKNVLFPGNIVIVKGSRTKTGDSLVVEKTYIART